MTNPLFACHRNDENLNALRRLACRAVAFMLCGCAMEAATAQDRQSHVTLSVRCQDSQYLTLTIQNVGSEDTAVIFGSVLANGGKYLIDSLTLQATSPDGQVAQYDYRPDDYPAGIAGRVDDWIVPLPAGTLYVMRATPSQFLSSSRGRLSAWPNPAELSLRLPIRAPRPDQNIDVVGLKLFRVWRVTEALMSNQITVPGQCG